MTSDELDAIRQRAGVRDRWSVGRIGDPVPWCRYCEVKLPGETQQARSSVGHEQGCPVPDALAGLGPDFDALLAEVSRLRS